MLNTFVTSARAARCPERELPMSSAIDRNHTPHDQHRRQSRDRRAHSRILRRGMLAWLVVAVLLVVAVPTVFFALAHRAPAASATTSGLASTSSAPTSPADRF